jgi:hypothetical protein
MLNVYKNSVQKIDQLLQLLCSKGTEFLFEALLASSDINI